MNSLLFPLFISYRSCGEKLIKYQANSFWVIVSVVLMTALYNKALILQRGIWYWSLLGLKGLRKSINSSTNKGQCVTKILRILKTTRFNKVLYNLEEEAQRRRSIDKVPLQIWLPEKSWFFSREIVCSSSKTSRRKIHNVRHVTELIFPRLYPGLDRQKGTFLCMTWSRDQLSVNTKTVHFGNILSALDCKTVGFPLKISKEIGNAWCKTLMRANRASQSRSLFSASFHTFCLTARAYLNTQKYVLFCGLCQRKLEEHSKIR